MATRASPRKSNPTERARQSTHGERRPRRCLKCPGPNYPLQKDLASHAPEQSCGLSLDTLEPIPPAFGQATSDLSLGPTTQDLQSLLAIDPVEPDQSDSYNLASMERDLGSTLLPPFNNFQAPTTPRRQINDDSFDGLQLEDSQPSLPTPGSGSTTSTSWDVTPSPSASVIRRLRVSRTIISGVRQRPTRLRPTFGMMSAKKGSATYDVVRTGALVGRVEKSEVNRRFTRSLDRILLKCERLADETDGWLFIAAQHPSVQGEYVHWTSPAMAAELPPQARTRLNTTTSALFSALKTARRQNVAEIELQATKARAERDLARNSLAEKEAIIERLSAHLRSQGMSMDQVLES
ncbi:hypothetical protein AAF712_005538 [Marasmius tenuissimus]|uniref:Uncharacterized protein n=1 Tax=Marasmius tenuissimus TaxID=585030 RepID=A0ABR3A1V2_9AGAR